MTRQVTLNELLKTPPIPGNTSGGGKKIIGVPGDDFSIGKALSANHSCK